MKTRRNSRIGYAVIVAILVPVLNSCYDHEIDIHETSEYFPLSENTKADYLQEYSITSDGIDLGSDTVTLTVSGDTLIDGLTYKKINNQYRLEKVVRSEGSKYFGRNHEMYGSFSQEYLFLDTSLPVNSSWAHIKNEGYTKTEYVVKDVHSTHVVHGVEYKDVIKLEVNYYDKYTDGVNFELLSSSKHYYAAGVGEIYAYYSEPIPGLDCNLNISILPASK